MYKFSLLKVKILRDKDEFTLVGLAIYLLIVYSLYTVVVFPDLTYIELVDCTIHSSLF